MQRCTMVPLWGLPSQAINGVPTPTLTLMANGEDNVLSRVSLKHDRTGGIEK